MAILPEKTAHPLGILFLATNFDKYILLSLVVKGVDFTEILASNPENENVQQYAAMMKEKRSPDPPGLNSPVRTSYSSSRVFQHHAGKSCRGKGSLSPQGKKLSFGAGSD